MRTVFWEDNRVKMIDQRLLPGEFVIAEFDSVDGVARSITEMYVRGAPAIGATGAYGMALAAQVSGAVTRDDLLADEPNWIQYRKEAMSSLTPVVIALLAVPISFLSVVGAVAFLIIGSLALGTLVARFVPDGKGVPA